jgi:Inner membrane component of T3SS, cytoplasmic domain
MDAGTIREVKLAVIEVLDRDGHARHVVPVWRWPISIGRAIDCDVVLDDPHVASHHAVIDETDGALDLQVGDTVNGAILAARRVPPQTRATLATGSEFQLGTTRLRVRRASDALAPEQPVDPEPAGGRLLVGALVLVLAGWQMLERWIGIDPGGRAIEYLPPLLGSFLVLAVWCGFWSLGSRLFRHRFDYWRHARIATTYIAVAEALRLVLPLAAFVTGWVFFSRIVGIAATGVIWAMIVAHLALVLSARRRFVVITMVTLFAVGVAFVLTRNYQITDRVFGELYMTTLAPPALRLAPAVSTKQFIEEAKGLKAVLDSHVNDDSDTGGGLGDDD